MSDYKSYMFQLTTFNVKQQQYGVLFVLAVIYDSVK